MSNEESLYNYHFISKVILTVRDFIDASAQLFVWTEAKQKYHLSSSQILNWLGLIKCIPRTWRNLLISTPIDNCNIEEYPVNKELSAMTSKIAYQNLFKPSLTAPTAQRSLEEVLKLADIDWTKIYTLPRTTTIESSLRTFQYKILNNILYLNERLFKFNMDETPLCSLCNQASEFVSHLFCTCTKTCNLWRQLCAWLANQNVMLPSNLVPQTALLGLWNEPMQDLTLINHVILMFKCYIYLKKKETTGPSFFGLNACIKNMETTERKIASQREKNWIFITRNGTS